MIVRLAEFGIRSDRVAVHQGCRFVVAMIEVRVAPFKLTLSNLLGVTAARYQTQGNREKCNQSRETHKNAHSRQLSYSLQAFGRASTVIGAIP